MTQLPDFRDTSEFPKLDEHSDRGILCPRCERRSRDESFCEHCQFELPSASGPVSTASPASAANHPFGLSSFLVQWPNDPGESFQVAMGTPHFRVRAVRPELWTELAKDVQTRRSLILKELPPIHVLELGGGAVILAETWPQDEEETAPESTSESVDELLMETLVWCRKLAIAMDSLHRSGHVWLDFDPYAVEFSENHLRITNLDWRVFPSGKCPALLARISKLYSPPEVCQFRDEQIGPRTDVFHLAIAAYYRLAGLNPEGFGGRGLESFSFEIPPLRIYRPDLPTGVWPILKRALAINANQRPASPIELIQQLERVTGKHQSTPRCDTTPSPIRPESRNMLQRLFGRKKEEPTVRTFDPSTNSTTLEIGWQSVTGRAKSAAGAVNQDRAVVLSIPVHQREIHLMITADGVTHSRVGKGERASQIGCEVLVASIREQIQSLPLHAQPDWPGILDRACQSAGQAIVAEALSIPDRPEFVRDNDLMSSTVLIGLIDGQDLLLGNVGDSRAYLVANGIAEQLTVDGDVASTQLAQLVPPEQVQEIGGAGKALRFCLGACRENENGQLVADLERARPQLSLWPIKTGEIYVLCSDGLVEERVFLEPEDLVRIIQSRANETAQQMAEELVAAADARQRLPSISEPSGYGDNVTCIVIKSATGPSKAVLSGKG